MKKYIIIVAALFAMNLAARAADEQTKPEEYPLKTCVVSGDELGGDMGDPIVYHYEGREIQFCCKDCIKKFNKHPEKYLKMLDDASKAKQADPAK